MCRFTIFIVLLFSSLSYAAGIFKPQTFAPDALISEPVHVFIKEALEAEDKDTCDRVCRALCESQGVSGTIFSDRAYQSRLEHSGGLREGQSAFICGCRIDDTRNAPYIHQNCEKNHRTMIKKSSDERMDFIEILEN